MRRLCIFLKYPTPGLVKTRLAAAIGRDAASEVSRLLTALTLERLETFRRDAVLCVDPPSALTRTRAWLGRDWLFRPQHGSDLGERLAEATTHAFAEGARRVIVVGTDSPWLQPGTIEAAFAALERAEMVIGPARDGGYYLIGLSRLAPALFEAMAWSTPSVCADTVMKARELGLQFEVLQEGRDVDHLEDLQRWLADEQARGQRSTVPDAALAALAARALSQVHEGLEKVAPG
jgi:rSAM/selenodomain-associated transferase 1